MIALVKNDPKWEK